MPKMYNPDTQQTVEVDGKAVKQHKDQGFVTVGNRPAAEYEGKSREELQADDAEASEAPAEDTGETTA